VARVSINSMLPIGAPFLEHAGAPVNAVSIVLTSQALVSFACSSENSVENRAHTGHITCCKLQGRNYQA
jgi:hypothetical protein